MKTTATTEAVSSDGMEKRVERRNWRQIAPCAGEKPWAKWKKGLANLWSRKRISKTPTRVAGKNPYGKSRFTPAIIHTLMKITLPIIALGLILTGCSKAPSDAEVAKKLPGAWHMVLASPNAKGIIFTFSPDDNFTNQIPTTHPDGIQVTMVLTGTFQVRDGYLIETITNISNYSGYLPVVERFKIVQSDDRELIFVDEKTAKKITIDKDTP